MAKRYVIWDGKSQVITPSMEVFTAEQWKARYPICNIAGMTIVGSAGVINGGFFGVLQQMEVMYANRGADFSACTTDEEKLEVIEAWEDAQNTPSDESTAEERIAAALEVQNMQSMETVNTDDPDEDTSSETSTTEDTSTEV